MQFVIPKRVSARRRSRPIARLDTAAGVSAEASPCPNPACRAPGWPLVSKPLNWPWAEHCWNCDVELR